MEKEIERLRKEIQKKDDRIDDLLERLDKLAVAYQRVATSGIQTVRNDEDHDDFRIGIDYP
jgi:predicted RNase H-like nuclease